MERRRDGDAETSNARGELNLSLPPSLLLSVTLCLSLSLCTTAARGGWPHWRRRPPAPSPSQSDTYAPQMRHYNVVDPVGVAAPTTLRHGHLKNALPPDQVFWRQKLEAVPAYPWGWFGARRHVHNSEQTRYYGNERDWSYLRGD
jgi:hypothetical protein